MPGEICIQIVNTILGGLTGGDRDLARHAVGGIEAALAADARRPGALAELVAATLRLRRELSGCDSEAEAVVAHLEAGPLLGLGPLFLREAVRDALRPLRPYRNALLVVTGLGSSREGRTRGKIPAWEWRNAVDSAIPGLFSDQSRVSVLLVE